ncbi:MAG: hypothetical protein M1831_001588 [Alyxoria varia]|nr:MAG: hypothetical protein M1831_001588 [Alyxoria varia]
MASLPGDHQHRPSTCFEDIPAQNAQESAPAHSSQYEPPQRKRVDWHLPESASSSNISPLSASKAPSRDVNVEDELRDNIGRLFRNNPPHSSQSTSQSNSLPPREAFRKGRKSAIRASSGTSPAVTPPPEADSSHSRLNEGVVELEDKTRSLATAQHNARALSERLQEEPEEDDDGLTMGPQTASRPSTRGSDTPSSLASSTLGNSYVDLYHDGPTQSGAATPHEGDVGYVPRPSRYRSTGLSLALARALGSLTPGPPSRRNSQDDIESQAATSATGTSYLSKRNQPATSRSFTTSRNHSVSDLFGAVTGKSRSNRQEDLRIKKHIQDTRVRQKYLTKLANSLMSYGAPTHRLEEYMSMSARALDIEAQFWYVPGIMIMSFDDSRIHTTEVKMVKNTGGIDLGKLRDVHEVYKHVVHDKIGAQNGIDRLDDIDQRKPRFNIWLLILAHGLASLSVGPFAFTARWIDLGPAFCLGCLMGVFRVWISPMSDLYSCVFETCATIALSFASRALGSIRDPSDPERTSHLFCFSALLQSSMALILPGYAVLLGALELQSRSIIAGAVRMVYAIFLALLLGFSITIGTTFYGTFDAKASVEPHCAGPMDSRLQLVFVPIFTLALMVVNQAKLKQMPMMMLISMAGHTVNYFSSRKFPRNAPISSALAALTISFLANASSRLAPKFGPNFDELKSKALEQSIPTMRSFCGRTCGRLCGRLRGRLRGRKVGVAGRHGSMERLQHSPGEPPSGASTPGTYEIGNRPTRSIELQEASSRSRARPGRPPGAPPKKDGTQEKKSEELQTGSNYSLAAASMLPAMFVLVPSGLSVAGSLVEGIQNAEILAKARSADLATSSSPGGVVGGGQMTSGELLGGPNALSQNSVGFQVGYNVVQVAIGITVGLYIGTMFVYPLGKSGFGVKRKDSMTYKSGLFSF